MSSSRKASRQPAKNADATPKTAPFVPLETAEHFGSREETQLALEEKIAAQNTRRLHSF